MWIGISERDAETRGARWTAAEIAQQPDTLRQTHQLLSRQRQQLDHFMAPLLERSDLRIIFAGAGTSAFIGDALAPIVSQLAEWCVEAIPTTDIVSVPQICLTADRPTLFISFGRSGNSPESLAAIELADQLIDDVHHLIITCNQDGALARYAERSASAHLVLLPDATHDRSFAMTSSFTAMMYAALLCLGGEKRAAPDDVAQAVALVRDRYAGLAIELATQGVERAVYLGSGGMAGLAREGALKLLEMTDGATVAIHDTPLGFRHGPKAFLNSRTLVVLFVSNNPHTRRYDLDLLAELARERTAARVLAVTAQPIEGIAEADQVVVGGLAEADDAALLFPFIVMAQMIGVHQALALGKTPDDPNPAGIVNRVVQGVRIHAIA